MCLSELERRCNCLFQTTLWLQKKWELLWYGVVFHCSNKANCATSLFFYLFYFYSCLITTPPISKHDLREGCLILCPKLVLRFMSKLPFFNVFSSQPEFCLNKESRTVLCCSPFRSCARALAPSRCKNQRLINTSLGLISPDKHVSHLGYSRLQSVTCLGMCWHHHFAILSIS